MRSYYSNSIAGFLQDDALRILGSLTDFHNHALEGPQKGAWKKQIEILKNCLQAFPNGYIYFEFGIPRMGKRVDNILVINDTIFVLEFKVGDEAYQNYAINQVVDYCLDLQNFHEGSHFVKLAPIVVATDALPVKNKLNIERNIYNTLLANDNNIKEVIELVLSESGTKYIDPILWANSPYKPTPTIVQAAQALYKGHNVKEISRNDAGAINLTKTGECINHIIESAKKSGKKSICFLTGVPGAGKTLAGLNVATQRMHVAKNEHAVFLSGNGPLVFVLREALAREAVATSQLLDIETIKKAEADRAAKFIQNIHHFRDENYKKAEPPVEKVVVFDEAQRAWDSEQTSKFMKKKKGFHDFNKSEPDYLISVMDRHPDWCTIVCLIGGGQEINKGEAGVWEWLTALKKHYNHWDIHYSHLILTDSNYLADDTLRDWLKSNGTEQTELHLSASMRSFKSERVSEYVHQLLNLNSERAKELHKAIFKKFPIYITRNLDTAKAWLKKEARGTERIGIVSSSGGRRLRATGVDVKNRVDAPNWFLNEANDVRSSYYLEEIATEFTIQGLEIDWVCLAWDINLYFEDGEWVYKKFSGTVWKNINDDFDRKYLLNAYRVLLTRARQGMVIYLPYGNHEDITRPPALYDQTFEYLKSCGIPEL